MVGPQRSASARMVSKAEAPIEDDYDPRKPAYIVPATVEEARAGRLEILVRQIEKLEAAIACRRCSSPQISTHYEKIRGEMLRTVSTAEGVGSTPAPDGLSGGCAGDVATPEPLKKAPSAPGFALFIQGETVQASAKCLHSRSISSYSSGPTRAPSSEEDAAALRIRLQIEYYMSNENLKTDPFFHSMILASDEGWVAMTSIQRCPRIRAMGCTMEDIVCALESSSLVEVMNGGIAIRRRGNAELPRPEFKPRKESTSSFNKIKIGRDKHLKGIVKSYSSRNNYGFIVCSGPRGKVEVFLHSSVLHGGVPAKGDHASFLTRFNSKGVEAYDVQIVPRVPN